MSSQEVILSKLLAEQVPSVTEPFQRWAWRAVIPAVPLLEQSQKLGFAPHFQCVCPGTGCRNKHLHQECVIKFSLGQEKGGEHGAEDTHSYT